MTHIPFHRPSIGQEEIDEVVATMKSGWLTTGPRTARFEEEFREYAQVRHALAVNSCTAGMHLALAGMKIGPGDEVITSPLTFAATVNVIVHVGATPVLADVGADGNIDPQSVATRVTEKTRAVMPVHLAGQPCQMDAIWSLAQKHDLNVIEDCAHAAGTHYRCRPVGPAGAPQGVREAAAYSFYAIKNITTAEGGMVTTNDERLAESMKILSLHGISRNAWNRYTDSGHWYYEVLVSGFKYNLSDIQSAIGIHQLRKLERFIELRSEYAALYTRILGDVEELECPPQAQDGRHSWHLYMLRLNLNKLTIGREEFIQALRERGVGTSVHFIPIFLHPFFAAHAGRPENHCPQAQALFPRLITMPLYPAMTPEDVEYCARAARDIALGVRKSKPVYLAAGAKASSTVGAA
jgi:dTDP-4-amino-4,6-dideoxygalactose transaminase